MINTFDPIPAHIPPSRHKFIYAIRGQIVLQEVSLKKSIELHDFLVNEVALPANDDDLLDPDEADARIEALERRFGIKPEDEQ